MSLWVRLKFWSDLRVSTSSIRLHFIKCLKKHRLVIMVLPEKQRVIQIQP